MVVMVVMVVIVVMDVMVVIVGMVGMVVMFNLIDKFQDCLFSSGWQISQIMKFFGSFGLNASTSKTNIKQIYYFAFFNLTDLF